MKLYRVKRDFTFSSEYHIRKDEVYKSVDRIYRTDKATGKLIRKDWMSFGVLAGANLPFITEIHQTFMIADGTKEKGKRIIEKLESFGV